MGYALCIPANCQGLEQLLICHLQVCNGPGLLLLSASPIRKTPLKTNKKASYIFQYCILRLLGAGKKNWHATRDTV